VAAPEEHSQTKDEEGLSKESDWHVFKDEDGDLFFHNPSTNATSYGVPDDIRFEWVGMVDSEDDDEDNDDEGSANISFYYNVRTGESVTERPDGFQGQVAE